MKLNQIRKKIGFFFSISTMKRTFRGIRNARRILELGGYRERCEAAGIVIPKNTDLWKHFRDIGARKNIDPCELFDIKWYKARYLPNNVDQNPLLHYLIFGERKGKYVSSILKPKIVYELISNHLPKHKSYLLGLMEEYSVFKFEDTIKYNPDLLRTIYKTEDIDLYNLTEGIPYLKEKKIKYKYLNEFIGDNKLESRYVKNPFFGYHLPYNTVFKNVEIIQNTADIIVEGKKVINDELFYTTKVKEIYGDPLKDMKYHDFYNGLLVEKNVTKSSRFIEEGIHLTKEYNENYFHAICELGIKLAFIDKYNLFNKNIPLIISGSLHNNILSFFDVMNVNKRRIIKLEQGKRTSVRKLYYLSDITVIANSYNRKGDEQTTVLPSALLKLVRKRVLKVVCSGETVKNSAIRRVYISRNGGYSGIRKLVDEKEVEQYLAKRDFEIIKISELSFDEQVRLFSSADLIVAPTGAAMTNLLWCRPSAKVLIFYPDHPRSNTFFWKCIADCVGLDLDILYGRCVGEIQLGFPHSDYEMDVNDIGKAVDKAERELATKR